MKLHPYQEAIASRFVRSKAQRIVVACPTGSGKTVIGLHGILPELSRPVAWITHRIELKSQVARHRIGVDIHMIQSFQPARPYASIIIDEAHHVCAAQYRRLFEFYPHAKFVALTATPYRMDGQGLGSCGFTSIIYGPDVFTLTQMGFLCPARVFVPASESQTAWTVDATLSKILSVQFRKGIAYCNSVSDAKTLAAALSSNTCHAAAVDAGMDARTRKSITRKFRAGKISFICNHTILTEGYDVPAVDLVVLNRRTQSRCLWRQMTGRGLRTSPNKKVCTILDLAGNGIMHGSIYDKEIFDLNGTVTATESRALSLEVLQASEQTLNHGEELKEWAPPPKPVAIIESLQRLKSNSPLRKLLIA